MKSSLAAFRQALATTYSVRDLCAVSLVAALVSVWAAFAGGAYSVLALFACEAVFLAFYLVGSLFAAWRALATEVVFDLPLRLLVGYAVVNTALMALAWLSPLGMVADFGILFAIAASLFVASRPTRVSAPAGSVGLLVVGLSLVAATLWCQDSIRPISTEGDSLVYKPWIDGFYHAVHIRIFGASHGAATIEDFRLAGVPARLYHYGIYFMPAFIKQASGIASYTAFAGILAPVGVFFTGLATYAFVGSLWGAWPGLAACAALLLLPDGAQQGMGNTFMSYHWLTQISPSATYGLALLAVVWLFVLRACTRGSWSQLLAGWLLAAVLAFYKLHFFIASALLLMLVPPLFFQARLGLVKRGLWAVGAVTAYVVTLNFAQNVPGVPVIRLDGSCVGQILSLIHGFAARGDFRDFLAGHIGENLDLGSNLLYGIPYVLLAALGVFVPLLLVLAIVLRKRITLLQMLFPVLVIANFLVMFFGLALDFSRSTPDELSHRPVMVVYFFVVAWVGGAAGLLLFESQRLRRASRPALVGLAVLLLVVPAHFGSGVQQMWNMARFCPVRISNHLIRIAAYMREHGSTQDVFQDSQFDWIYAMAALAERRPYACRTMTRMPYRSEMIQERAEAIDQFMGIRDANAIGAKARELGFQWFLLQPGDRVDWPEEVANKPVLEAGPFRLYRF